MVPSPVVIIWLPGPAYVQETTAAPVSEKVARSEKGPLVESHADADRLGWGQHKEFCISVPISAIEDSTRCEAGDHRRCARSTHRFVLGASKRCSLSTTTSGSRTATPGILNPSSSPPPRAVGLH